MNEEIFKAIREDDLDRFTYLIEKYDYLSKSVDSILKNTLLHTICQYGADNIFNYYYPKLKKPRKNMLNKYGNSPFYFACIGTSDKIFDTLLNDSEVDHEKMKKSPSMFDRKPIVSTLSKPEYWYRILKYYAKDEYKGKVADWFTDAMKSKSTEAIEFFIDNGLYRTMADYSQRAAIRAAITYSSWNTLAYMINYDISILYVSNNGNSILTEAFSNPTKIDTVFSMFSTLEGSPYPFDSVIYEALRYNTEHANFLCEHLARKNVPLSDYFVVSLFENKNISINKQPFYNSVTLRKDGDKLFDEMQENDELFNKYAPENIKTIFMF